MWTALAIAGSGVLAGALLGLRPSRAATWVDPLRAAGLGSGLLAVFVQLLPEAASDLGLLALLPFAVAVTLTGSVEWLMFRRTAGHDEHAHAHAHAVDARANLELGLFALGLHQLVEGVALGALASEPGAATLSNGGALFALAAHTIPVVAVFVLAARQVLGLGGALARSALLFGASTGGVALSSSALVLGWVSRSEGWVHAAVAGLLLHAILHVGTDLHGLGGARHAPQALRWAGFAAGAGLVLLSLLVHDTPLFESWRSGAVVLAGAALAVASHRATPHNHRHDHHDHKAQDVAI